TGEYVRGDVHTNTLEGYYSIFKRGMNGIYQHCSERHLHRYVAEFDFRYNNRMALGVEDQERTWKAISPHYATQAGGCSLTIFLVLGFVCQSRPAPFQETTPAMNDPMLPLPGLSPVSGKTVVAKFDGGLLSSDGGVLLLRESSAFASPIGSPPAWWTRARPT